MAELEHWLMWRERCAAGRCTPEAQHDLAGFAFNRFRRCLHKVRPTIACPNSTEAWHAFESHLALGSTRPQKAWKAWLFARGGDSPTLDCIQGGATLIMRHVVRAYLRREYSPPWIGSLDAIDTNHSDGAHISLAALIPDPAEPYPNLEAEELQTLADSLFATVYNELSFRERIALTIHHTERALSHPTVVRAASCSKSSLSHALHRGGCKLAEGLKQRLPNETDSTHMGIARRLIEKISDKTKKVLEMTDPECFMYIKGGH